MSTVFHVDFKNKKLLEKKDTDVVEKTTPQASAPTKISKKEYFQQLINTGMVQVCINPKARGVKLPASLKSEPVIMLNWSQKFHIKDFEFDDKGVRGTLSFNSTNFFVDTPWKSIWAIFLANNPKETMKMWEEDLPKEISLTDFLQEDK